MYMAQIAEAGLLMVIEVAILSSGSSATRISISASEETHRPGPGAIHRRLDSACIRILARHIEIAAIVECSIILRHIETIDGHARGRHQIIALRKALHRPGNAGGFPICAF